MLKLFIIAGFPYLFTSRVFNSISVWIDFTLIFTIMSFHFNAPAYQLGIAAVLYGFPGLLLGPFIGQLADRYSPVVILLASSLARLTTSLWLATETNQELFFIGIFLKGISNLGFSPAEQILIRELLNKEQILSTIALSNISDQCIKIASPLFVSFISTTINLQSIFYLTAIMTLTTVLLTIRMGFIVGWVKKPKIATETLPRFRLAYNIIRKKPGFYSSFLVIMAASLTLGLYDSILSALLREQGFGPNTFGIIVSCTAAGAIFSGFLFKKTHSLFGNQWLMILGLIGFSITVLIAGTFCLIFDNLHIYIFCTIWFINGFCYSCIMMSFNIVLQNEAPTSMLGIISTSCRSAQLATLVAGSVIGSGFAHYIGIPMTFVIAGSTGLAMTGYLLFTHLKKITR
ncbi:enterobactin exporter EntS [Yersinia frederiksenii]|uniref:MFS transporter n=1 Tax=Yersinia frederiksenii TaxID=29484 RepID=UPI0005E449A4|nr:MFS transporter [Yersinia frederiksenii]CNB81466.1 enterobactin exporter EntS [Yersinia frederiksenii]CNE85121.1 enterobactin exporter EntS [Yersinia frederiksenii]